MATTAQSTTWLIFRIGRVACAVPALAVETIVLAPEQLTALPGSDAGRPGLFRYGHETVAAIDLRYRFGLHDADHRSGRLLLGRIGPSLCGFWVDSIVGMVDSHELSPTTLPPELPHNVFTAALLYRKEIVLCSDLNRLHAMRDAGAALQRMARPEAAPAPETKPAADGTSGSREPARSTPPVTPTADTAPAVQKTAATAPSAATTAASAVRPVTPPPTQAEPIITRAVQRAAAAASNTRTAPAQPASTTRAPSHTPVARRPATPPPSTHRPRPEPVSAAHAAARERVTAPQAQRWEETASFDSPATGQSSAETSTGKGGWVVLLLLLALAAGGGTWYLFKPEAPRPAQIVTAAPVVATAPAFEPQPVPAPATPPAVAAVSAAAPPRTPDSTPKTLVAGNGIEVQQDREGITIIIERDTATADTAPTPAPQTTTDAISSGTSPAPHATSPELPAAEPAAPAPPPAPPTPTAEPSQMYVHTVVKGDTLWDIAERYLDDPWRYKDLAQLSRIKNPDLIYPGNKIRIIIR